MKNSLGMKESDPDLMTPPWGCYWFGQWLANMDFAAKQGMEFITVHKKDGQGRGELDRFPTMQDWEGTDGKQFSKDGFLGGSQVRHPVPSALSPAARVCTRAPMDVHTSILTTASNCWHLSFLSLRKRRSRTSSKS